MFLNFFPPYCWISKVVWFYYYIVLITALSISVLLILASQRIETLLDWAGAGGPEGQRQPIPVTTKRGSLPSIIEWLILGWVAGKN